MMIMDDIGDKVTEDDSDEKEGDDGDGGGVDDDIIAKTQVLIYVSVLHQALQTRYLI